MGTEFGPSVTMAIVLTCCLLLLSSVVGLGDATMLRGKATMGKEDGHCELCLEMTHQMQHGEVPSCYVAGNANSYAVCNQVAQSLKVQNFNIQYWLMHGCLEEKVSGYGKYDPVVPCPSHVVCSWVPNLYQRDQLCPADFSYIKPGFVKASYKNAQYTEASSEAKK